MNEQPCVHTRANECYDRFSRLQFMEQKACQMGKFDRTWRYGTYEVVIVVSGLEG
jgi:hypothetical protein